MLKKIWDLTVNLAGLVVLFYGIPKVISDMITARNATLKETAKKSIDNCKGLVK